MHVDIAQRMIEQQLAERRADAAEYRRAREFPTRPHSLRFGSYRFTVQRDPRGHAQPARLAS